METLLSAVSFSSILLVHLLLEKYVPHSTQNQQKVNQPSSQASLELTGGVLSSDVVTCAALTVRL